MENKQRFSAVKCDCKRESGTLRPCGTSINWDITKIARGAKTQIWWPREQRTFTVDLTLSRHSVLVAEEELQAEWKHASSVQTLWHHEHIHACLTLPSTPHTHTQMFLHRTKTLDRKDTLSFSKGSRYIVILHSFWQPGKISSTKTLPEEAVHCVPLKRNSYGKPLKNGKIKKNKKHEHKGHINSLLDCTRRLLLKDFKLRSRIRITYK